MKEDYDLTRYFGDTVPSDVLNTLAIDGIRPLKSGSKFKVAGERGEFIFLYARENIITCFTPGGQFKTINQDKVTRAINRSKRERLNQ